MGQTAQEKWARDPSGVYPGGHSILHNFLHSEKGIPVNDSRACVLGADRWQATGIQGQKKEEKATMVCRAVNRSFVNIPLKEFRFYVDKRLIYVLL